MELANATFEMIKDELIREINVKTQGCTKVVVDDDGEFEGRPKKVANIGKYAYVFITDLYDSLDDWMSELDGAHFMPNDLPKTVKELADDIVYQSMDQLCIGIDERYVLALE